MLLLIFESLVKGRGSSRKGKCVLEVQVGTSEQVPSDCLVLGRVQVMGYKKGWAGFLQGPCDLSCSLGISFV